MIGWGPFLLSVLAAALLLVVAFDASSGFHASTYLKGDTPAAWLHNALNAAIEWLSHLGVQDWVLVGAAAFLLAWAWVRAMAFVRLGTIQIADLTCDDERLAPAAAKAVLQQALGQHGLLPPSGVPSGSPSVASIADAISKVPIPQANWLGSLLGLIPLPPSSTGFRISGNLRHVENGHGPAVRFAYELVCTGPRPSVHLGEAEGPDPAAAITAASIEIYRTIADAAPDIYPTWARWHSKDALLAYRDGSEIEAKKRYEKAYRRYMDACTADPDNMIARLRAANCLERMATGARDPAHKFERQVEALAAYLSIRVRRPSIFEAGFRASVLMSVLASEPTDKLMASRLLQATIDRFERATARIIDPHDSSENKLPRPSPSRPLNERLATAALTESRRVRRQLRPLWTLRHEKRLRHRFEPTGRERRQLRKALGISAMAQKARRERGRLPGGTRATGDRLAEPPVRLASELRQLWWRILVKGHYLGARWHVAGWPAHYNAACFYALLPRADRWESRPRGTRTRRRAIRHLEFALDQACGVLDCVYVRDEDPDLGSLRRHSRQRFTNALACMCPDEIVIHYQARGADGGWQLRAWGTATRTKSRDASTIVAPAGLDAVEVTFRIPVFDENCDLWFRVDPHSSTEWRLTPAALITAEIWIDAEAQTPTIRDVNSREVAGIERVNRDSTNRDHRVRRRGGRDRRADGGARLVREQ